MCNYKYNLGGNFMKETVKASTFVMRQTKGSGKSYSETLTFDEIASIAEVQINMNNYKDGYRDGVVLVKLESKYSSDFICPLVKITPSTKLTANYVKRREDEEPYIQIRANGGEKLHTDTVDLVLYRSDVLKETSENSADSDWELIAFMAIPKGINMPMGPITMMRNQLQKTGGTKGKYTSDEWANSIDFWQKYAISDGE